MAGLMSQAGPGHSEQSCRTRRKGQRPVAHGRRVHAGVLMRRRAREEQARQAQEQEQG